MEMPFLIIHGSNKSNSEGRCIAKSLYGNLPKSLQLKWEQKPDKSIYIYLVEAEGGKMADTDYSSNTVVLRMKTPTS